MATKKGYVLLNLLIPRNHMKKNMDVYLETLVNELDLWHGIHVYDVSCPIVQRDAKVNTIFM